VSIRLDASARGPHHQFMLITVAFIALAAGLAAGWMLAIARRAPQLGRAAAERDLALEERKKVEAQIVEARQRASEAQQARVAAETKLVEAQRRIEDNERFIEQSKQQLEDRFKALAQEALTAVGQQLVERGKEQIDGSLETKRAEIELLLKPLHAMVDGYRAELVKSEHARVEAYGGLQEQIKSLLVAQESAHREASRLANALQSPTVRGSWGESSLRRCVEMAGMSEFCDFTVQETFASDEGKRLRPDLIVKLPNERVIAIDAKVPLSEYTQAANETDEGRRREFLVQHAKTVRRHIDALSRREYQASIGESLDFVVLFIPGEHFLSAALITDVTLFDYAVDKKIYLASPTVLLPLLRAIGAGWKAERTEENAKRMHDAGVELFNRFVKVMEYINSVGEQLRKTVESYNNAMRSIDTRLWPKAEELQRLAGSGKELGPIQQIDAVPLESSKLRLTMQPTEDADVVPIRGE
jgi:DNA recombination protein RmuC